MKVTRFFLEIGFDFGRLGFEKDKQWLEYWVGNVHTMRVAFPPTPGTPMKIRKRVPAGILEGKK